MAGEGLESVGDNASFKDTGTSLRWVADSWGEGWAVADTTFVACANTVCVPASKSGRASRECALIISRTTNFWEGRRTVELPALRIQNSRLKANDCAKMRMETIKPYEGCEKEVQLKEDEDSITIASFPGLRSAGPVVFTNAILLRCDEPEVLT